MDALKRLDIEKNTIVIFISDNGGVDTQFDNSPLRYGKGSAYEGGIRVPFIIKWPGITDKGKVVNLPVHIIDLYPTLCEIAGKSNPSDVILDGVSLVPMIKGKKTASRKLGDRALYFYQPLYDIQWGATPSASVIKDGYKLILFFGDYIDLDDGGKYIPEGRTELYNLSEDTGEKVDLAGHKPDIVRKMKTDLIFWILSQGAELPELNNNFDINRWNERSNTVIP
jgi:arylsulfatase A-like enzyme